MNDALEIISSCLLFLLVFGMSATVDIQNLRTAISNRSAILTGLMLQFGVLPFLGFAVVKALNMSEPMGITLLVVTSSPGGSYSNWWCSMFNADLALSVTMTAISTLCSVVMLPLNLVLYSTSSFEADIVSNLDWTALFVSLVVVISAIGLGLLASAKLHSEAFNLMSNKLGNFAGISLVVFSIVASAVSGDNEEEILQGQEPDVKLWVNERQRAAEKDVTIWNGTWEFYLGVAAPCFLGLVVANALTTTFQLAKPERVTVSVECCYQNVGIATQVAITMFDGDDLAEAIGVPLYYGIVEALILGLYCIIAWKMNWTKAPSEENLCVVIANSYEVKKGQEAEVNAIEVVLSEDPSDLMFVLSNDEGDAAAHAVEKSSLFGISYRRRGSKASKKLREISEQSQSQLGNLGKEEGSQDLEPGEVDLSESCLGKTSNLTILSSNDKLTKTPSPSPTKKIATNFIDSLKCYCSSDTRRHSKRVLEVLEQNTEPKCREQAAPDGIFRPSPLSPSMGEMARFESNSMTIHTSRSKEPVKSMNMPGVAHEVFGQKSRLYFVDIHPAEDEDLERGNKIHPHPHPHEKVKRTVLHKGRFKGNDPVSMHFSFKNEPHRLGGNNALSYGEAVGGFLTHKRFTSCPENRQFRDARTESFDTAPQLGTNSQCSDGVVGVDGVPDAELRNSASLNVNEEVESNFFSCASSDEDANDDIASTCSSRSLSDVTKRKPISLMCGDIDALSIAAAVTSDSSSCVKSIDYNDGAHIKCRDNADVHGCAAINEIGSAASWEQWSSLKIRSSASTRNRKFVSSFDDSRCLSPQVLSRCMSY